MGVDEDIQRFRDWSMNLGISPNILPAQPSLTRAFSSGQALAFEELMRRIRPKDYVNGTRDKVTVKKIEQLSDTMVSSKATRIIPQKLRLHQKRQKLREQLSEVKSNIDAKQIELKDLSASIKNKNIRKMQLKEQNAEISAKNSVYQLKMSETEQKQIEESEISTKLDQVLPVKYNLENGKLENAEAALKTAKNTLQKFYAEYDQSNSYEVNSVARTKLWENLHKIFLQIPIVVLWNCLTRGMANEMSTVETLLKSGFNLPTVPNDDDNFQIEINKLYAKHMRLYIQKHNVMKDSDRALDEYLLYYDTFLSNIRAEFRMYNKIDVNDDILAELIANYSSLHFTKGEIDSAKRTIATNHLEIKRKHAINDTYQMANNSLRQIYADVENAYVRGCDDINALTFVKTKIVHSKQCLQYLLQYSTDHQPHQHSMVGATTIRSTKSDNSSDNIFQTSMSDSFGSTRSDNSVMRRPSVLVNANFINEIKAFSKTSINLFKSMDSNIGELEMGNPLIKTKVYDTLPDKVKPFICDHLISPSRSLDQLAYEMVLAEKLKTSMKSVTSNIVLPQVDDAELDARKRRQDDEVAMLGDKTAAILTNAIYFMVNVSDYLDLFKNNPLAKFIPNTKLVEGKTYREYEQEYVMYYNMNEKNNPST